MKHKQACFFHPCLRWMKKNYNKQLLTGYKSNLQLISGMENQSWGAYQGKETDKYSQRWTCWCVLELSCCRSQVSWNWSSPKFLQKTGPKAHWEGPHLCVWKGPTASSDIVWIMKFHVNAVEFKNILMTFIAFLSRIHANEGEPQRHTGKLTFWQLWDQLWIWMSLIRVTSWKVGQPLTCSFKSFLSLRLQSPCVTLTLNLQIYFWSIFIWITCVERIKPLINLTD